MIMMNKKQYEYFKQAIRHEIDEYKKEDPMTAEVLASIEALELVYSMLFRQIWKDI